ncbi:Mce associated membrane protein [Mycolicibacterium mageritense]
MTADDEKIEPEAVEEPVDETADSATERDKPKRTVSWSRVAVFGLLPTLAVLLAGVAGYLKWQDNSVRNADTARAEAVQTARDAVAEMLSYQPDTVDQQLGSARDLLTGDFQKSYTALTTEVVIPGAKQKQISAQATVPAVASASATADHAVVLVFVNQTVVVGQDPPTNTASSVRVTLDKVGDRWLISEFDPV